MIYQTKHTKGNYKKAFLVFLFILFFVFLLNFFSPIRSLMFTTLSPFFQTGSYLNNIFATVPKFFWNKNSIIAENERLAIELEKLRAEFFDYEFLKIENQQLHESLNLMPSSDFLAIKIIARSPQTALDTLLIDRGGSAGLTEGSLIFGSTKILVGSIVEFSNNKSIVALNSFPGKTLSGYIARTDEILEINGIGGGSLEALVPIDFDIEIDDRIIAEGSSDAVVALVRSIEENVSSGFKKVLMSLPLDISKSRILFARNILVE